MSDVSVNGVVSLVEDLVRRAIDLRATDVHFEPDAGGMRVRLRVDALLQNVDTLPAAIAPNVVARLKVLSGLLTYRTDVPQEGTIAAEPPGFGCDIRVATFPTIYGERVVLRLMAPSDRLLTLERLGHAPHLIERLERRLQLPQGLVIVCGPAGSGKTTTLFAMLDYLLKARPGASILTVEDPVEIRLCGVTQVQLAPARGLTYPAALRSLLRQDPQILMIGEIRDAETAHIVVEAALTGHLLLTTLHSGSPGEAIVRLREMGLPPYQLTSTIAAILAQRLLRTVCSHCNAGDQHERCRKCRGTGYAGRTAIGQLLEMSAPLREAVLSEADVTSIASSDISAGTLDDDARRVLNAGATTEDEIRRVLGDDSDFS